MTRTKPRLHAQIASLLAVHAYVLGVDEAGIGSWAGPAIACGVVVPVGWKLDGLTDSKLLSPSARERLFGVLTSGATAVTHYVVRVDSSEIDQHGIGRALPLAHKNAIIGAMGLHAPPAGKDAPLVIVDGHSKLEGVVALPKADLLVQAVSAAAVIAKVTHDRIMLELDQQFPGYGFSSNQGYGTEEHRQALLKIGVSACHRMSYAPMRALAQRDGQVAEIIGETC